MLVGDHMYIETYSVWTINNCTIVNILQLLSHQILLTSLFAFLQHRMVTKKWPKSMVSTPYAPFRRLSEHQILFNLHIRYPKGLNEYHQKMPNERDLMAKTSVYTSDVEALYSVLWLVDDNYSCSLHIASFFSILLDSGSMCTAHCLCTNALLHAQGRRKV